jgi:hypothetical protein
LFPASEGYFLDTTGGDHPLLTTGWALGQLYGLHLHHSALTLYHLDPAAGKLCAAMMADPRLAENPIERMVVRLLAEAAHVTVLLCAKGRFFEQMTEKLSEVAQSNCNELVTVDLYAIASSLVEIHITE